MSYSEYAQKHGVMHAAPRIVQGGKTLETIKGHTALPEGEEEDMRKRKKYRKKLGKIVANLTRSGKETTTAVYITGIPLDSNESEVALAFSRCGIIRRNEQSGEPNVRLYRDTLGNLKGDGIVIFLQRPSVDLAIELLNGTPLRPGGSPLLKVEPADLSSKSGSGVSKSKRKKKMEKQLKQLGWEGDDDWLPVHLISVVIENLFTPEEIIDIGSARKKTIINDIRTEAGRCGSILNVRAYWKNPKGVIMVRFKEPEAVQKCVDMMNGRWYARRQLKSYRWDGFTSFGVQDRRVLELEREEKKKEEEVEKEAKKKATTLTDIVKQLEVQYQKANKSQHALNFKTVRGDQSESSYESDSESSVKIQMVGEDESSQINARVIINRPMEQSATPLSVTPCNTDEESIGSTGSIGSVGSVPDGPGAEDKRLKKLVKEMIRNGIPPDLAYGMAKETVQDAEKT
mmetsp:Transcript_6502/g.10005  ORF Transcript_6502/g.10005 Transcript_6502/m.10005 type:complete len:457 (-) Transcript_6502:69-1439(-)